jgi:hypothetical protein
VLNDYRRHETGKTLAIARMGCATSRPIADSVSYPPPQVSHVNSMGKKAGDIIHALRMSQRAEMGTTTLCGSSEVAIRPRVSPPSWWMASGGTYYGVRATWICHMSLYGLVVFLGRL